MKVDKKRLRTFAKYGCCIGFAAVLALTYLWIHLPFAQDIQDQYRMLCDAFTIPGVVLIAAGALVWVANEGVFIGVSYCVKTVIDALIPGRRLAGYEKYGDYVERKSNRKIKGYSCLFFSGAVAMAVASAFMLLFYFFEMKRPC